jgi:hypothetical protein
MNLHPQVVCSFGITCAPVFPGACQNVLNSPIGFAVSKSTCFQRIPSTSVFEHIA